MRDIRSDLKERLEAMVRERQELQRRVAAFENSEQSLRALLAQENARFPETEPQDIAPPAEQPRSDYERFILDALSDGEKWTTLRLKLVAGEQQRFQDQPTLGRVFHAVLIGLRGRGLVELVEQGTWRRKRARVRLRLRETEAPASADAPADSSPSRPPVV